MIDIPGFSWACPHKCFPSHVFYSCISDKKFILNKLSLSSFIKIMCELPFQLFVGTPGEGILAPVDKLLVLDVRTSFTSASALGAVVHA